jgi:hypothetical protein
LLFRFLATEAQSFPCSHEEEGTVAWQMLGFAKARITGQPVLWHIKVKCSGNPGHLWVICRLSRSEVH